MQDLSWKERPTGVIFHFLKSITQLKDDFQTDRIVFCFESKKSFRRDIYPEYKLKRSQKKEMSDDEFVAYMELKSQIQALRKTYLPQIGFKNVLSQTGMESDDIMAAIALKYGPTDDVVLVTSDSDLFQCVTETVSIYSPQKRTFISYLWVEKQYGITPKKWALFKAIAGCKSDEVKGIPGIGEITALKYLRGELDRKSKAFNTIQSPESRAIVRRNRPLVELPYKGCETPNLTDDNISKGAWIEVCTSLGMKSLAAHPPIATRRMTKMVR